MNSLEVTKFEQYLVDLEVVGSTVKGVSPELLDKGWNYDNESFYLDQLNNQLSFNGYNKFNKN